MASLHFISGLPRAGSTLLAALLAQNPRFHAGMTGPVHALVEAALGAMSMAHDTSVFIDDARRERVLRGLVHAFHGDLPADHVAFDTDRGWCAKLALIARLFPAARVIACVRDVAAVVESVERLVQANPLQPSGLFGFEVGGTVWSRAEAVGSGNGMVGAAFNGLRQAWLGPQADRLLLLTYETLVHEPARAMAAVYRFLDEPAFDHDVDAVTFDAEAFDRQLGTPGLHRVGRSVRPPSPRPPLLPPELAARYARDSFWLDSAGNPNGVPVV